MTTTAPEIDSPRGYYGGEPAVSHVKNLLARATVASAGRLTPEIIRKMRRHHQVSSCLLVQSLPLVRADWAIESDDPEIAERLTAAYEAIAFHVHRSMARALAHGYSPNTLTWTYREDLRILFPGEIRDLEPSTCKPRVDDDGTLDGFTQRVPGSASDEAFDAIYALWIVEGMESGNYYGRSILDAALDPWSDAAAFRAFHARYLERFGEPVVLARAPSGKSIRNAEAIQAAVALGKEPPAPELEDNLSTALDMGRNLRHHSVIALPSSLLFGADGKPTGYAWNLEFLESKGGGGDDFLNALRECDRRIARAMFVPDLLAQNDGLTGSNALGQTHKSVWTDTVEGRLDDYSRQITEQLVEPARILAFGAGSSPARLVFRPLANEELDREWQLVVSLVEKGELPVDGRELAQKYGLPLSDEDETPPEAEPVVTPGEEVDAEDVVDEENLRGHPAATERPDRTADERVVPFRAGHAFAAADPVAGLPDWRLPQSYDPPPFSRELNARERRVGFAALEDGLNRWEASTISAIVELLDGEHERVLRQLSGILRKGTPAEILDGLGTLEIKGGPAVSRAWAELMAEVSGIALEQLRGELADYADTLPETLGPEGRALFRSYAATNADRALSALLTETRLELLNAYTSGVGKAGMAAIVGQIFDAHQGGEGKPLRLTTRMLSAKSLNYSRAAAVERGGIPLAGAQYSAVLDRRTCDLCEELDESVIAIESTDLSRFTPPIHHNCRCVWAWITRTEPDFTPTWSTPARSKVERYGGLVI